MKFEQLAWDSDFFKKKIGKISIDFEITDFSLLDEPGCEILYIFSKARQPLLEQKGFAVLDTKVNYFKKGNTLFKSDVEDIISYHGDINDRLIKLALQSGWKSRFKMDANLNNKFEEMYFMWLKKSLDRTSADDFFVAMDNVKVVGFVSVLKTGNEGKIALIAVDEDYRGKGIGSNLVKKTEYWCVKNNLPALNVITQIENKLACRLYEKNHFTISNVDYIYHYSR